MRYSIFKYFLVAGLLVSSVAVGTPGTSQDVSGLLQQAVEAYRIGKAPQAEEHYKSALAAAERLQNARLHWQALISFAWFLDETGRHKEALELSNQALVIARKLKDPFAIGRSLSWIAWAYKSMGLYELALNFYGEAARIGDPKGAMPLVIVWGLSSQEMGAIQLRMGKLPEARQQIEGALAVARQFKVGQGIAECSNHLAEIALLQGDSGVAVQLSREALQAAEQDNQQGYTSIFNVAHSKRMLARSLFEHSRVDAKLLAEAKSKLDAAQEYAARHSVRREVAMTYLLRSELVHPENLDERLKLVNAAQSLIDGSQSELRGTVRGEVGKVLLENDRNELAAFYLEQGFKINKELFSKLDNAFLQAELAELKVLEGDLTKHLQELEQTVRRAKETGALALQSRTEEELSEQLEDLGYSRMSLRWTSAALASVNNLLASVSSKDQKRILLSRKLILAERRVRLELALTPEMAPAPG